MNTYKNINSIDLTQAEQEERAAKFLEQLQARSRLADERTEYYSALYATFESNADIERHRKNIEKAAYREALEARRPLVEEMVERSRTQMNEALDDLVLRQKRPPPTPQVMLNPQDIAT